MTSDRFVPHPLLEGPERQTCGGSLLPRRPMPARYPVQRQRFTTEPGTEVEGWFQRSDRGDRAPLLVLAHGLGGHADSGYLRGTALKALVAGFDVLRLNTRGCGGTEALTSTFYHAGLTQDLRSVLEQTRDRFPRTYLAGFSLGGNMSLKLAGELGDTTTRPVDGIVTVCPALEPDGAADVVDGDDSNTILRAYLVGKLRSALRRAAKVRTIDHDLQLARRARGLREFDEAITAPEFGFRDAADYYARAAALPGISAIRVPTLILTAKNDPVVPFEPFRSNELRDNPAVRLCAPDDGGHCGFVAATPEGPPEARDRRWAEHRVVEQLLRWETEAGAN